MNISEIDDKKVKALALMVKAFSPNWREYDIWELSGSATGEALDIISEYEGVDNLKDMTIV